MQISPALALIIILAQIIFLEIVLSLDNAAVLGTIVLSLPADQRVPWPKALKRLGRLLDPLLGYQRTAGLRVGLLGAYTGQALMLVMASFIIHNPWLQLIGAAYLLKMSVSALGASEKEAEEDAASPAEKEERKVSRQRGFWATVVMVELMDLAFSLDNVVVVVSISPQLWLVMLGVAVGILGMRFAAGLFSRLIEKVPPLATAAYILVFNIGVEFVLARLFHLDIPDFTRFVINVGTLVLAFLYAKLPIMQIALRIPLKGCQWVFYAMDRVFNLVLFPVAWVWGKLIRWLTRLFREKLVSTRSVD
jgi:tellurite resistance protein TerC